MISIFFEEENIEKNDFYSYYEAKNQNNKEENISTSKEIENDCNNFPDNKINEKKLTEEKEAKSTEVETKKRDNLQKLEPKESLIIKKDILNDEYNFDNIIELKNNLKPLLKKKRGRAKKKTTGDEHNKFSDDNMRRKCKHILLDNLMDFINLKIREIYTNIGYGRFIKKLLIINQNQIANATILFNKQFLNKPIGEIFSDNISSRYTNYESTHNHDLILNLINDEDETKKSYFKKLFDLKFIDCLKHFRQDIFIPELEGLTTFQKLGFETELEKDYLDNLKFYIMNYEEITNRKKERKLDN